MSEVKDRLVGEPIQPVAEPDPLAVNLDELIRKASEARGFRVTVDCDKHGWNVTIDGRHSIESLSWPELIADLQQLATPQPVEPAKPEPIDLPALIARAKEVLGCDVSGGCGRDGSWYVFVWNRSSRLDRDRLTYAEACEYIRELGTPKPPEPVAVSEPPKQDTVTVTIQREAAEYFASQNFVGPRMQGVSHACKTALTS